MENVICSCLKCGSELGSFRNSWIGIGNSYFSPIHATVSYRNGFVATGEVFTKGADGTAVQNSILQDLACRKCATVVGLRCDDAPEGHILTKNQLILRLAEMSVVSEETGAKASIVVQEKIPLLPPGTKVAPAVRRAATLQPNGRSQRSGSMVVLGKEKAASRNMPHPVVEATLEKKSPRSVPWTEDAISNQQKDIDRIGGAVARIERDIRSFKDFMAEVRAELAATRETRKTQDDLRQEQFTWIQEDLKELRQDTEDFQRDIREEELPSIHNAMDQLREELDSQYRAAELPVSSHLHAGGDFRILKESVKHIDDKFKEVEGLKFELQKLQQRLASMEDVGHETVVFPRTLRAPKRPDYPTIPAREIGQTVAKIQTTAIHPAARLVSPSLPGALPNSTAELDRFHDRQSSMTPKPSGERNGHEIAATASPLQTVTQRWTYTAPHRWQSVKTAYQSFGLLYPKLGSLSHKITELEMHVNNSRTQRPVLSKLFGQLIEQQHSSENNRAHSQFANIPGSSRSKRKHDQVEDGAESVPLGIATKRLKGRSKDEESIVAKRALTPPVQDHRLPIVVSSDHGSPELGRESMLRVVAEKVSLANSTSAQTSNDTSTNMIKQQPLVKSSISNRIATCNGSGTETAPHASSKIGKMAQEQFDELSFGTEGTPKIGALEANLLLQSIERDETHIPGSFPLEVETPAPKAPVWQPSTSVKRRKNLPTPFSCGSCSKRYTQPSGLKAHKNTSSCQDHPDDVIPTNFACASCNKNYSFSGLAYHLSTSQNCGSPKEQGSLKKSTAGVSSANRQVSGNQVQQPKGVLTAQQKLDREKLVKEALERA